jgi:arylsulfatase A-like enzyme
VTRRLRASLVAAALLPFLTLWSGCSKTDNSGAGKAPSGPTHEVSAGRGAVALKQHSVLLVTLDTTRADYLSCYDPSKGKLTPNLDAVAADGVRFERAIAQAPATPMSHASILTGLNPYQHGVRVISAAAGYELSADIPTLATVLQRHGWATGAFLSAFTVSEYYGFDHGFDTFDNGLTQDVDTILIQTENGRHRWVQRKHQRRSDATTDAAIAWLRSTPRRPFFMWVHYWDPHDRMVLPPQEVLARYVNRQMARESPQWKRAIYRAEVWYMDSQFGRLVAALKESGDYVDTVIAIVADHGQGLGQHDWWAHRLLYQEDLHVPLIVRVPRWPVGKVVPELVRTVDIYPTVLEALGWEARAGLAGKSLQGLVQGRSEPSRLAYADMPNKYDLTSPVPRKRPKDELLYCAMDHTWKLIYRYSYPNESELYNVKEDPRELNNLFVQEPEQVKRLKAALDEHNGYVTGPLGTGMPDADALRALESLGYVAGSEEGEEEAEPNAAAPGEKPGRPPTSQP